MNIVGREIRSKLKTFIIWIWNNNPIHTHVYTFHESIFGRVRKYGEVLGKSIKIPTQSVQHRCGSLFNAGRNLWIRGYDFIYILTGIFASVMAGGIFAKEFEKKTIEFLLVKPISRKQVFRQKALALLIFVHSLSGIFTVGTLVFFDIFVTAGYSQKFSLGLDFMS